MRKKTEDGNAMQDIEAASVGASSNVSEEKENTLRFLVLDCRNLKGVDATAAKRCFCELHQFAKRKGFSIVFAGNRVAY